MPSTLRFHGETRLQFGLAERLSAPSGKWEGCFADTNLRGKKTAVSLQSNNTRQVVAFTRAPVTNTLSEKKENNCLTQDRKTADRVYPPADQMISTPALHQRYEYVDDWASPLAGICAVAGQPQKKPETCTLWGDRNRHAKATEQQRHPTCSQCRRVSKDPISKLKRHQRHQSQREGIARHTWCCGISGTGKNPTPGKAAF